MLYIPCKIKQCIPKNLTLSLILRIVRYNIMNYRTSIRYIIFNIVIVNNLFKNKL